MIGHSNGGMLAVRHVVDHPQTPALVLLSAHGGGRAMVPGASKAGLLAGDRLDEITAQAMYPKFIARIESLRAQGIDITSLTNIYASEPDTLYVDACCHVNQRGYDRMAEAIGTHIVQMQKGPREAAP